MNTPSRFFVFVKEMFQTTCKKKFFLHTIIKNNTIIYLNMEAASYFYLLVGTNFKSVVIKKKSINRKSQMKSQILLSFHCISVRFDKKKLFKSFWNLFLIQRIRGFIIIILCSKCLFDVFWLSLYFNGSQLGLIFPRPILREKSSI